MRVISSSVILCALVSGCGSQRGALEQSREFFAQGNYYQAYTVLEETRDLDSLDEELEREYWRARLFYLLHRGQELVFLDREAEAIEEFQKALALEPENRTALDWVAKARAKLADRAANEGDGLRTQDNLEAALEKYQEALRHVPGHVQAMDGQRSVEEAYDQRIRRAKDEHMRGVRKMPERRYNEVWRHETTALDNDPSHEDARTLHERVLRVLADEQFARAVQVEDERKFGAALIEYLTVKELIPDYEGLEEHIEHMRDEVDAEALVLEADMVLRRAQYEAEESRRDELFAEARELLQEAFDTSISGQARISEQMVIARRIEYETYYYAARDLELQYKYEDSIEAYTAIDGEWPDGFMDVKARITDLEESVAEAEAAYKTGQEAERQGDIPAAIAAYRYALVQYPTYKGLEEKVKALSIKG